MIKIEKETASQEFQDFKAFLKDFEIFVRLVTNIMSLMPNIEENQENMPQNENNEKIKEILTSSVKFYTDFVSIMNDLVGNVKFLEIQFQKDIEAISEISNDQCFGEFFQKKEIEILYNFENKFESIYDNEIRLREYFDHFFERISLDTVMKNLKSDKVKNLRNEIDNLKKEMDQKNKEYEENREKQLQKLREMKKQYAENTGKYKFLEGKHNFARKNKEELEVRWSDLGCKAKNIEENLWTIYDHLEKNEIAENSKYKLETFEKLKKSTEDDLNNIKSERKALQEEINKYIQEQRNCEINYKNHEKEIEDLESKMEKNVYKYEEYLSEQEEKLNKKAKEIKEDLNKAGHNSEKVYILYCESMKDFFMRLAKLKTKIKGIESYISNLKDILEKIRRALKEIYIENDKIDQEKYGKDKIIDWAKISFPNNERFLEIIKLELNDANAIRYLLKSIKDKEEKEQFIFLEEKFGLTNLQAFQFKSYFNSLLNEQNVKQHKFIIKSIIEEIKNCCSFLHSENSLDKLDIDLQATNNE